jgi:hypothetical protein
MWNFADNLRESKALGVLNIRLMAMPISRVS